MLKSFQQLEDEAGPQSIFATSAVKPSREPLAGYDTPGTLLEAQKIADRSVFAAAFRQDNTVVSFLSNKDLGTSNHDDGVFDAATFVRDNPQLAGYEDAFSGVLNQRRADAIKSQIETEQQDRQTLQASGWNGTFAQLAAGVFDAPTLIPGTVALRGVKGGYSIGKSLLIGAASAGATQAGTEALLQSSQQTRTADESLVNIGAAAVMGSLIGGSVAAVLGKNEKIAMAQALEKVADINSGAVPNTFVPSRILDEAQPGAAGAQVVDGAFYVDPLDAARSVDELSVDGRVAGALAKGTAWLNPVLRGTQRYASSARQLSANLYEDTIYRALNRQGETTGAAVETVLRYRTESLQAEALSQSELAFKEMAGAGVRLSRDAFYDQVGAAMRNSDKSDNPFVARAAQAYRKLFDDFTNDAVKLELLDADNLDVKTAASYFSRVYNKDRLLASEPEFLQTIGEYYAKQMQEEYALDNARLSVANAKFTQRADDQAQVGPARGQRIKDIMSQGEKLDAENPQMVELANRLREARGQRDSAAVKRIQAEGGKELADYLDTRAELRRRRADLTVRNPDAQLARGEKLQARVEKLQAEAEAGLSAFARQAKNLILKLDSDPVAKAQDVVARVEQMIADADAKLSKLEARLTELDTQAGQKQALRYEAERERFQSLLSKLDTADGGVGDAADLVVELDDLLTSVTEKAAKTTLRRGQRLEQLSQRAEQLSPEAVAARAAAQRAKADSVIARREEAYQAKWGVRRALDLETDAAYDFEAAARAAAKEVYDKITGKGPQNSDLPSFVTRVSTGPLKDRTFLVPDELLAGKGWLVDDVRSVANTYARSVGGEIELTRRFGDARMGDQFAAINKEYSELRQSVAAAQNIDQLNAALGRSKFRAGQDLEKAKTKAQVMLSADEKDAVRDLQAGRDMIRGTYNAGVNNTNFASVTRSLLHFNYVRAMGGVLMSNIADFYRPAMVHGIGPYLKFMPTLLAQAVNRGSNGVQASLREANLAGLVVQRVTHALTAGNGDIADPFLSGVSSIERLMQKGSRVASRFNFINVFTDAQQAIASTLSQHRILEAVLGNSGKDGSMSADGEALIRMLGIGKQQQQDIAKLFAVHGETLDGIKVANTEKWLAGANASGRADEILRTEAAVRAYRAALNLDVNSIVSRKGLGDSPLFANHPVGKLLTQFSGYAMGAHSRVTIRGMQEGHARMIGGITALTALGMLSATLSSWRGGQERWDKFTKTVSENPAYLVGEGLDRSGFFALMFDASNRVERLTSGVGYGYRVNPIKSPIVAAGGGDPFSVTSTRASDSASVLSAFGGPTAGLADSALAAARVAGDALQGKTPPKSDVNQALAVIPFNTYIGVRELLQVATGNSTYLKD